MKSLVVKCYVGLVFLLVAAISSCQWPQGVEPKGSAEHIRYATGKVDDKALQNIDAGDGDWLTHGGNYAEDRYSELELIHRDNLSELSLAWTIDVGTKRGLQSTPLVVDGIMFFTGPWSIVYAVDVRSGQRLWTYDPEVPRKKAAQLCCGVNNRGLALYRGSVFVGTLDGRLISVDAASGEPNWQVQTVPEDSFYSITGAPRIANGLVIIGNGGADLKARGYVTAYDAGSGAQRWRFYTVPGDPALPFEHDDLKAAVKTWSGEWWKQSGGGTVWDAITYDPELNLVYIGVGNGSHWNRMIRSPGGGDNLYLSSIVALDASDGSYVWHYQTTPGDTWDYTATQHIIQADIEIDGKMRKVLMQAPKNGFFYVIDRTSGEFISAKPFVYTNWASAIDAQGRPIENEGARYEDGKLHWISPSSHGGHNWPPMAFNRKTGLVYIPTSNQSEPYMYDPAVGYDSARGFMGAGGANTSLSARLYAESVYDTDPRAPAPWTVSGRLIAYDPVQQREVWGVDQVLHYNGGLLTTANGLLLQGDAQGIFSIRDAENGEVLWQYDVRSGVVAPPITYMVDGEQYISVLVGWGGIQGQVFQAVPRLHPGTLYTFKLGGDAQPPAKLPPIAKPLTELTTDASELTIGRGYNRYAENCMSCHGTPGTGNGTIPDLTRSNVGVYQLLPQIVLQGLFESQGMPNFAGQITPQDVEDIRAFLLFTAQSLRGGMTLESYLGKVAVMQKMADENQ